MSDPIDQDQTAQHTLTDWLELHGLDRQTCLRLIDAIKREAADAPAHPDDPSPPYETLDTEATWAVAIAAMHDLFPACTEIIDDTFQHSEKIAVVRSQKSRKAVTIDRGPSRYPTILYSINGDPSDQLVVAHEFGHALQIRACGGAFVPPVTRELCAFIAEGALLSYSQDNDAARYGALFQRWREDNFKYLGRLAGKLERALADPGAPYRYGWNYPIARLLSLRISRTISPVPVWEIFNGQRSLPSVLRDLEI